MEINWFTFVAQIINFLILVFLLQRFLYEPIIKVINQRKNKIKAQLLDAEQQMIQAHEYKQKYLDLIGELEAKKQEFLSQAKLEVEAEKTKLLNLVKTEIEESRKTWQFSLKQEQDQLLQALKNRASESFLTIIKKSLNDLANQSLELQIVEVFLDNLAKLDQNKKQIIESNLKVNHELIIQTSFNLTSEKKEEIIKKIQENFKPPIKINFTIDQELLCGINLIVKGEELNWSLDSYLNNLEATLKSALEL